MGWGEPSPIRRLPAGTPVVSAGGARVPFPTVPVVDGKARQTSGAFTPDQVAPPQAWPDPEQAEPCPHEEYDCDGTHWHAMYADLWRAHDELMHQVRTTADSLVEAGSGDERRIGGHLRAMVGRAAVRRNPLPPPR